MNSIYMLVEGEKTEPKLYEAWMPLLLPGCSILRVPEEAEAACGVYILAGYGYPSLLNRIQYALEDVRQFRGFGRLLICLDSEERTVEEVKSEVESSIEKPFCPIPFDIIVANCAIESWLLGNRRFVKRQPSTEPLTSFMRDFDVTAHDPELLPNLRPLEFTTRAQCHKRYLKAVYQERGLTYSERNPGPAQQYYYLEELIARANASSSPKHLHTFRCLLDVVENHLCRNSESQGSTRI